MTATVARLGSNAVMGKCPWWLVIMVLTINDRTTSLIFDPVMAKNSKGLSAGVCFDAPHPAMRGLLR